MIGVTASGIGEPLAQALEVIAGAVSRLEAKWLIGGSTGLLLRGLELPSPPRDLDLYADDEAARTLHAALRPYAVDEQQLSVSPIYRSILSHYEIHGVQVELVGGFVVAAGQDRYTVEVEDVLEPLRLPVSIGAFEAGIVPLAHELWFNMLRAREDRVSLITTHMRKEPGLHQEALWLIAARNELSAALQEQVAQLLRID